jgi:hypothetical protein
MNWQWVADYLEEEAKSFQSQANLFSTQKDCQDQTIRCDLMAEIARMMATAIRCGLEK